MKSLEIKMNVHAMFVEVFRSFLEGCILVMANSNIFANFMYWRQPENKCVINLKTRKIKTSCELTLDTWSGDKISPAIQHQEHVEVRDGRKAMDHVPSSKSLQVNVQEHCNPMHFPTRQSIGFEVENPVLDKYT